MFGSLAPKPFCSFLFRRSSFAYTRNGHSVPKCRKDDIALTRGGMPAPGAFVAVCTQPAVTSTTPCTPLANLCSSLTDGSCSSPNPVQADGLGNYHFYILSGTTAYTVQIYGSTLPPRFSQISNLVRVVAAVAHLADRIPKFNSTMVVPLLEAAPTSLGIRLTAD